MKAIFILVLTCLTLSGMQFGFNQPTIPGQIEWATFNDGTGVKALDFSGYGNSLDMISTVWTNGIIGGCLLFNGTSSYGTNSFFTITNFTVSAWILIRNYLGYNTIVNKGNAAVRNFEMDTRITTGKIAVVITQGSGNYKFLIGNSAVPTNVWTHVVGTYDGTTMAIYMNGVLDSSTGTISGNPDSSPNALYIGTDNAGSFFNGKIDDLRIFNRAVTPSEVNQLYGGGYGSQE